MKRTQKDRFEQGGWSSRGSSGSGASGRRPRGLREPSAGQERGEGPGVDPKREPHAGRPELAPPDERVHGRAAHLQFRGAFGGSEPLAFGLQWSRAASTVCAVVPQ